MNGLLKIVDQVESRPVKNLTVDCKKLHNIISTNTSEFSVTFFNFLPEQPILFLVTRSAVFCDDLIDYVDKIYEACTVIPVLRWSKIFFHHDPHH